jgi:hypothetical protein
VLEGGQRIGRIRFADESMPGVWLWNSDGLIPEPQHGQAEFKAAWKALKARTPPELLAAAFKAMNIRDAD